MKTRRPTEQEGRKALAVADEAVHLLRTAPFHVVAAYYIGSIPFMLGLLYFWSDMSRSAFAASRCVAASLGLAVLFIWMKCWQALYAGGLRASITGDRAPPWTPRRFLRLASAQTLVQPSGLLAIPAALLLVAPFCAVYSFYQNITALADGTTPEVRGVAGRAWRQARLWPTQGYILMWLLSPWILAIGMLTAFGSMWLALSAAPELHEVHGQFWFILALLIMFQLVLPLSPFGCAVAGGVAVIMALLPGLASVLLGTDTVFTLSGMYAVLNTTFLMTVYAVSYLCLDPLLKAAYVLRCFYGESRQTGEDLRVELRNQMSEARGQRSEVGSRRSEVGG